MLSTSDEYSRLLYFLFPHILLMPPVDGVPEPDAPVDDHYYYYPPGEYYYYYEEPTDDQE